LTGNLILVSMQIAYRINSDESIFDIAIATIGGIDNLFVALLQPNNINIDYTGIGSQLISYDNIYQIKNPASLSLVKKDIKNILNYFSLSGQSLYDICLQCYSSLDGLYKLIQDNNINSVDTTATEQINIKYNNTLNKDNKVNFNILKKNIKFVTAIGVVNYRITEDGEVIITEDGNIRIIE
jgi:hypothetical protein